MAIDKGDWHYDDAGSWERACRHIGLYLWWAAERGLTSDLHDAQAAAKRPTQYFIGHCDTKLWDDDFNADGIAFAQSAYTPYCSEVEAYARARGIGSYEIPEGAETTRHFFAWLDDRLARWRQTTAKTKTKRAPAKAKAPNAKRAPAKAKAKRAPAKAAKAKRPPAKAKRAPAKAKAARAKRASAKRAAAKSKSKRANEAPAKAKRAPANARAKAKAPRPR